VLGAGGIRAGFRGPGPQASHQLEGFPPNYFNFFHSVGGIRAGFRDRGPHQQYASHKIIFFSLMIDAYTRVRLRPPTS